MKFDTQTLLIFGAIIIGGIFLLSAVPNGLQNVSSFPRSVSVNCNKRDKTHCWNMTKFTVEPGIIITTISDTIQVAAIRDLKISQSDMQIQSFGYFIDGQEYNQAELNILSRYGDYNIFNAVYVGTPKHVFNILPTAGHTYQRTVIRDVEKGAITYILKDLTTGQQEQYVYTDSGMSNTRLNAVVQGLEYYNRETVGEPVLRLDVATTPPVLS